MKWFSIVVGGLSLISASAAFGQSRDPRDSSCACGVDHSLRYASPEARFFSSVSRTPVVVDPYFSNSRGARAPITTHSVARVEQMQPTPARAIVGCAPLQISLPEGLLNRLLTDERSEIASVRDVIARADVTGQQMTSTRVVVDLKPSSDDAELHLVLTGAVHSNTIGRTSQAAVNTLGRHDVLAVKPVMFDGYQITTKRPQVWVDVHNEHVAASTAFDGTLFGGMARNTAIKTANKQKAQVDAETAEHLADRLGPQFNRDADRQLAQFNREWRDGLRSRFGNLWPQQLTARSTDSELVLSAAWADAPEMKWQDVSKTGSSSRQIADNDAVTVWLHESVVNAWLRNLDLDGKTMTESQLREVLESFVTKLGGRVLPRDKKLAASAKGGLPGAAPLIRLGDKDPVRVTIADGELQLIVVAGIEVAGQTVLAQDEIRLPWSSKLEHGEWRLTPGQLAFAKADTGVSLVGMVETMVRTQLAAAIPVVTFPEALPLPMVSPNQSLTELRLASADASSGWLTFSLAIGAAQPIREPQLRQPVPEDYVPVEQFRSEPVPVSPPRLRAPTDFESRRDRSFFR